jgi:flagellar motility protein MotE (MotC chaperone)
MNFRPRLLPAVAGAALLLFCAKVADIWFALGTDAIATASAQSAPPPAKTEATPAQKAPDAPGEGTKPGMVKTASRDPSQFSPQEIQILQSLAQRRSELDKRASELDQREALLQAAEQRINEKIGKLSAMETAIEATFKKQDQQDDDKIAGLVKIYEAMKPKEAARIFEQLDLPVLLNVVERMKTLKSSAVLASMDPTKAKAVTLALAERHPSPALKN